MSLVTAKCTLRGRITPVETSVLGSSLLHMRKAIELVEENRRWGYLRTYLRNLDCGWDREGGRWLGSWWEKWVPSPLPSWATLRVSRYNTPHATTSAVKSLWNANHDWKSQRVCVGMVSSVNMYSYSYNSRECFWRYQLLKASCPLKIPICWILTASNVWIKSGTFIELPTFLRLQMSGDTC